MERHLCPRTILFPSSSPVPSSLAAGCPFINHNYMSDHLPLSVSTRSFSLPSFQSVFLVTGEHLKRTCSHREKERERERKIDSVLDHLFLCSLVYSLVVSGTKRGQLYLLSGHCSPTGHQSCLLWRRIDSSLVLLQRMMIATLTKGAISSGAAQAPSLSCLCQCTLHDE